MNWTKWVLEWRSAWGHPNFRSALYQALDRGDWESALFCFEKDPRLVNDPVPDRARPIFLAIESKSLANVRRLIELGADPASVDSSIAAPNRWTSGSSLFPSGRYVDTSGVPWIPGRPSGYVELPWPAKVNLLTAAWALGGEEIYTGLWPYAPRGTRFDALLTALRMNDEAWLDRLDLARCLADGPAEDVRPDWADTPTPLLAGVLGGVSTGVFERLWSVSPSRWKTQIHREGGLPDYGFDGEASPPPEGDLRFWARRRGALELSDWLNTHWPKES